MNTQLTEIGFVLDRSGSMVSMAVEAVGGFNAFLQLGALPRRRSSDILSDQNRFNFLPLPLGLPVRLPRLL